MVDGITDYLASDDSAGQEANTIVRELVSNSTGPSWPWLKVAVQVTDDRGDPRIEEMARCSCLRLERSPSRSTR